MVLLLGSESTIATGSNNATLVGRFNAIGTDATFANAFGSYATIGDRSISANAFGQNAQVGSDSDHASAVGTGAYVENHAQSSNAFGNEVRVKHDSRYANAIGSKSTIGAESSFSDAIGYKSTIGDHVEYGSAISGGTVNESYAVAIGSGSKVNKGAQASVALGKNSEAKAEDIINEEELKAWNAAHSEYASFDINAADTDGVISVGSAGHKRRIINVANGRIAAGSTDAINGGQLFGAMEYLNDKLTNMGIVEIKPGDQNIEISPNTQTTTKPEKQETTDNIKQEVTPSASLQQTAKPDMQNTEKADTPSLNIGLGDNVVLGENNKSGSLTVNGENNNHSITINKDDQGTISGLTNTDWDETHNYDGSSNAATEGQLHDAISGTNQRVDSLAESVDGLNNHINNLDERIDKVGAGAAALAALHPIEFDPDEKLSFAAGLGNYGNENAAALGAFYRPNEKTMLSLGGTLGNGENMLNLGVSFALDRVNNKTNSKAAMAKEIDSLQNQVAQLTAMVNELSKQITTEKK